MRGDRRNDNRGMTLVELLIAVTILAVIVVPLLHAFVSSARINRKAKESQKLTTLGQDIMEGLKAYSVEDLAYEFDYPGGCSEHGQFQLIQPSMIGNAASVLANVKELTLKPGATKAFEECTTVDQSIKEDTSGPVVKYKYDDSQRPRYYAITNVSAETVSGNSFKADVLITVDPIKYTSAGSVSDNKARHNDYMMAKLTGMDTTRDSFYVEPGTQIKSAYEELKTLGAAITSAAQISREIMVTVEDDPANPSNKKVIYKFKYSAYKTPTEKLSVEYPKSELNIPKYDTLENVYLFYIPSYNESPTFTYDGDTIEYKNNTENDIVFTLIKRQVAASDRLDYSYNDYLTLSTREAGYKCKVKVNDISTGDTEFRTNVGTDLSMFLLNKTDPGYNSSAFLDNSKIMNVEFNLNGSVVSNTDKKKLSINGAESEDRIFDVKIDIYEAGTIDNSMGSELPSDKHLVTVMGNMN